MRNSPAPNSEVTTVQGNLLSTQRFQRLSEVAPAISVNCYYDSESEECKAGTLLIGKVLAVMRQTLN